LSPAFTGGIWAGYVFQALPALYLSLSTSLLSQLLHIASTEVAPCLLADLVNLGRLKVAALDELAHDRFRHAQAICCYRDRDQLIHAQSPPFRTILTRS